MRLSRETWICIWVGIVETVLAASSAPWWWHFADPAARSAASGSSQFPHEAEGLNLIRSLLPPRDPFRAWSNFEFRDRYGN